MARAHRGWLFVGPDGFLDEIRDGPGLLAEISYHPNEMLDQIVRANGVTDRWTKDPSSMRRPRRIETVGVAGGADFDTGLYEYDGAGNVARMGGDAFSYDGVSRLLSASFGGVAESSAYDAFGNRIAAATQPVGSRAIAVDPATNRLAGTAERPVSYDERGNQIQARDLVYQYDAMDQLLRLTDTDPTSAHDQMFVYTADDERLAIVEVGPITARWRIRDLDGKVLRELDDRGGPWQWERDVVHRQGQVVAEDSLADGLRHAHVDHLGTIRLWTGPPVGDPPSHGPSHRAYTAFGEPITTAGSEPLRFTGHERDPVRTARCPSGIDPVETVDNQTLSSGGTFVGCDRLTSQNTTVTSATEVRFKAGDSVELGADFTIAHGAFFVVELDGTLNSDLEDLDYMHARYCSPVTGRFLRLDPKNRYIPLRLPQRWNRYAYALNNPIKYVDPDGRDVKLIPGGRDRTLRAFLVGLARRPSGRAALRRFAEERDFTLEVRDKRITSVAQVQARRRRGLDARITFGTTAKKIRVADGVVAVVGASVAIDTLIVQREHSDRSGVVTSAHEIAGHAIDVLEGATDAELRAGEDEAQQLGIDILNERPDISRRAAQDFLEEILNTESD